MKSKVCAHEDFQCIKYKNIDISKKILIMEKLMECTNCDFQRTEYEIKNHDLKYYKNKILNNLPPRYVESLEEKAERFLKKESYSEAFNCYRTLIDNYGDQYEKFINGKKYFKTDFYIALSSIEERQGNLEKALSILEEVESLDKKNENVYLNKINLKFELNNFESIYEDFARVIELNPVKDNYFAIGTAKLKLDDYEGAISDYTKAINLNPKYMKAFVFRGKAKFKFKDYEGAIMDYTQGIKLFPETSHEIVKTELLYYLRGDAKFELKDYVGSLKDYQISMQINPKSEFILNAEISARRAKRKIDNT